VVKHSSHDTKLEGPNPAAGSTGGLY
jgi:hypothetical protein